MKNKTNKNSNTGYRESNNRKKATVRSTFSDIRGSEQFSLENNVDKFIKDFAKTHDATKYNIKRIEKYLDFQDADNCTEDIVRASALYALCSKNCWGLTEKYLERIKLIIEKDDWKYSETQIVSFSVLGDYLHDSPTIDIFFFLISLLNNELHKFANNRNVETRNRIESIYKCLLVALKGPLARIDLISNKIKIPEDINALIYNLNNKISGLNNIAHAENSEKCTKMVIKRKG